MAISVKLCLIMQIFAFVSGFIFNVNELKNVIYDIYIMDTPLGFEEFKIDASLTDASLQSQTLPEQKIPENSVIIANEQGQKFVCSIPIVKEMETTEKDNKNLTTRLISEVVGASFYVSECISRNYGWWTYQLCFNKEISQSHFEGVDKITISLGVFINDSYVTESKSGPYYEQHYGNGSTCDLTFEPRNSQVRYFCDQTLETNHAYISNIEEISSCKYLITIKTGSLCKLEAFADPEKPYHVHKVKCQPLLSENDGYKFINKKIAEEKSKKKLRATIRALMKDAEKIQLQRLARQHLSLGRSRDKIKEEREEAKLNELYKSKMNKAFELSTQISGIDVDIHYISDDLTNVNDYYLSEEDEDRGNLYWYFKEALWDKTFFPVKISYARSQRKFNEMIDKFYEKTNTPPSDFSTLEEFILNIENGLFTENELAMVLGPLEEVFNETKIPGITIFSVEDPTNKKIMNLFSDPVTLSASLRDFRHSLQKVYERNAEIHLVDIMPKIARQLLNFRDSIEPDANTFTYAEDYSYSNVEKIYSNFKETLMEYLEVNDIMLLDALEEDENIPASDESDERSHNSMKRALNEFQAKDRLLRYAKRPNLTEKVKEYFHQPANGLSKNKIQAKLQQVKEEIKQLNTALENVIKESGLFGGVDIKIHSVVSDGNVVEFDGSEIDLTKDDKVVLALVKTLLNEDQMARVEADKYQEKLMKGYNFGLTQAKKRKKENDVIAEHDDVIVKELKQEVLPLLRDAL